MNIKVIQAANTSDFDRINGESCITYWEENKPNNHEPIRFCRATLTPATIENDIVGGHVLAYVDDEPHVFITPILSSVNTSEDPMSFDVNDSDLVQVPIEDEEAILNMDENKKRLKMLSAILRMKELMQ